MERAQRQEVVEEADPRDDARAAGAVEIERDPERCLGGRAEHERLATRGRPGSAPSARSRASFSAGRRRVMRDPVGEPSDEDALRLQKRAEVVRAADPHEVPGDRRRVEPRGHERSADALALRDGLLDLEAGIAQRGSRDARRRPGDRRGRAALLERRRDRRRGDREPDAERREPERLGHRSQDDDVRQSRDEPATALAPPYSTYASSTTTSPCGWARARASSPSGSTAPRPSGCSGLHLQITDAPAGSAPQDAPASSDAMR